ncbi:hypothetical protein ACFYO2_26550 [Streptomyces sp. NPDC006602]|uniref:hypothetical protein n=1 Tax=Streptomyces sp. NPDC006602 TaxID=3364751 RepID=UPI00367A6837
MSSFTTAELLEEGEEIDAGDQTEESVILIVDYVDVEGEEVRIWTKELAFPLLSKVGEQVTYAN